jgi:hypothetical protein
LEQGREGINKFRGREVEVIKRKPVKRGAKKVKMPRVEFDMNAIKEIKKRNKRSQKRR